MGGMVYVPQDLHRERQGMERPARWYVIWLGVPHAEGSVVIGRTKRLRRHRWHRAFPEAAGARAEEIEGLTAAMLWLLKVHQAGAAKPD